MTRSERDGDPGDIAVLASEPAVAAPLLTQLGIWLQIGVQSFGGGAATQYLIYRHFVERRGWLTGAEYTRDWGICQIPPGMHVLSLAMLIGWQLSGAAGAVVATVGLLCPSVLITIVLTALYTTVRASPVTQAALHGVIPATIGLGLLMTWQLARPLVRASRREGRGAILAVLLLIATSGLIVARLQPPVIVVLCAAGLLGAVARWWHVERRAA